MRGGLRTGERAWRTRNLARMQVLHLYLQIVYLSRGLQRACCVSTPVASRILEARDPSEGPGAAGVAGM